MYRPRRRRRDGAFTLVELMAVVAIVGVMAALAMATMSGAGNAQNSAALARSIQFALAGARANAVSDNFIRRLDCTLATVGTSCTIDKACVSGTTLPTTCAWSAEMRVQASSHATIWSITNSTDVSAQTPTQQTGGPKYVYFKPDGTVGDQATTTTGATVYVSDSGGTNAANRYKVYVYSATGMARLVNQW